MTVSTAIARLNAADPDFARHLDHLLSWESVSDDAVNQRVLDIIKAVRERGDAALVEFTQRFDGVDAKTIDDLILDRARLELALTRITPVQREALEKPPTACACTTSGRSRTPGSTPKPTAPCSARRSPRWTAPACTCRAARRRTRRRC
jgi:histidinol dehydrogenase